MQAKARNQVSITLDIHTKIIYSFSKLSSLSPCEKRVFLNALTNPGQAAWPVGKGIESQVANLRIIMVEFWTTTYYFFACISSWSKWMGPCYLRFHFPPASLLPSRMYSISQCTGPRSGHPSCLWLLQDTAHGRVGAREPHTLGADTPVLPLPPQWMRALPQSPSGLQHLLPPNYKSLLHTHNCFFTSSLRAQAQPSFSLCAVSISSQFNICK